MFLNFFYYLRSGGIKVSLIEWLSVVEGLSKNLNETSMRGFYIMCRALLVKDETDFDLFDRLFLEFFGDLSKKDPIPEKILSWLEQPDVTPEELKELMDETEETEQQIMDRMQRVMREQTERHDEGHQWVGTEGFTPFGHAGKELGGIRVGGEGNYGSAFRVASERKYRDWRKDKVLDDRQFQLVFKKLRHLTSQAISEKTELDIDKTIRKTGDNGGLLSIEYKAPRKNIIKLMVLIDSGGSMTKHQKLCTLLFKTLEKSEHLGKVEFYYFHNAIDEYLYETPDLDLKKRVPTKWVLSNIPASYRVIIVADGEMADWELYNPTQRKIAREGGNARMRYFTDFLEHYPRLIWLYPQKTPTEVHYWNETWFQINKVFDMYPLTIQGISDGIKEVLIRNK